MDEICLILLALVLLLAFKLLSAKSYFSKKNQVPSTTRIKISKKNEVPSTTQIKPRVEWTSELHNKFIAAVDELGGSNKATPNKILKMMNVEGLTRETVASHLQKYRLFLRENEASLTEQQSNLGAGFVAPDYSRMYNTVNFHNFNHSVDGNEEDLV